MELDIIQDICKMINDINQDYKAIANGDEYYFIINGVIHRTARAQHTPIIVGELIESKKTHNLIKFLENKNIRIDAVKFFQFYKENKKLITNIECDEKFFRITTEIPGVIYETEFCPKLFRLKSLYEDNHIEDLNTKEPMVSAYYYKDEFDQLKALRDYGVMFINIDSETVTMGKPVDESHLMIKINHKYLMKHAASSICQVEVYETEDESLFDVVIINTMKDKYVTKQYLKVVDY